MSISSLSSSFYDVDTDWEKNTRAHVSLIDVPDYARNWEFIPDYKLIESTSVAAHLKGKCRKSILPSNAKRQLLFFVSEFLRLFSNVFLYDILCYIPYHHLAVDNAENNFLEIVISGGEPLLHPDLEKILEYCEKCGVHKEITTNGSLIDDKYIDMMKRYNMTNVSVSLDSANPEKHDQFRQCPGAFAKTVAAIKAMKRNGISTRVRATISKRNIGEMDDIAQMVINLGIKTLAIGPMLPVGSAVNLTDEVFMNAREMKSFIDEFFKLKEKYIGKLEIITNECLHGLHYLEDDLVEVNDFYELNGCTAGVVSFNVLLNGDITPCSMFHQRIANIYEDKDLEATYTSSEIIHNLLDRNYKGKCGACDKKYVCGGCRVRAEYFYGDYLQEDKLCWL